MSHDFEIKRLADNIKKLAEEQKRINQRILQSRRDEQFDLDHIRRRYNAQIVQLEVKQKEIAKDMERREREMNRIQKQMIDDKYEDDLKKDSDSSSRRYRRL